MIRLFIVDDHEIVRKGLRQLLAEDPEIEICGESETAEGLVEKARLGGWDVLVLDINLPGGGGPDMVRRIAEVPSPPAVVIYTMYPEDSHAIAYFRAGARAFLNKRRSIKELAEAIHMVKNGRRYVTPGLSKYLFENDIDVDREPGRVLSPRELQIVRALAEGRRGTEIAEKLGVSASTVNTFVQRIKEKLGVRSIVEVVDFARDNGLLG
jgi:DNA-binding NarL/FixJ family response regulator